MIAVGCKCNPNKKNPTPKENFLTEEKKSIDTLQRYLPNDLIAPLFDIKWQSSKSIQAEIQRMEDSFKRYRTNAATIKDKKLSLNTLYQNNSIQYAQYHAALRMLTHQGISSPQNTSYKQYNSFSKELYIAYKILLNHYLTQANLAER